MKMHLLCLSSVLSLAACSGGGGNGKGLPPNNPLGSINPLERPSNPAPMSYISAMVAATRQGQAYVPDEAALFSQVFSGTDVRNIEEGGEDQKDALSKLNATGLAYRERIKKNCVLSPVTKVTDGSTEANPKTGDIVTTKLSMSSQGPACEFLMTKSLDAKTEYLEKSNDQDIYKESKVETLTKKEREEYRSSEIVKGAGIVSRSRSSTEKIETSWSYENKNKNSESTNIRTETEYLETKFANGDVVTGPSYYYSKDYYKDEAGVGTRFSESVSQSKMKSPRGDIWMTSIRKNGAEETEFYLNGTRLSKEELRKLFGVQ